jgi:hypothetical protein
MICNVCAKRKCRAEAVYNARTGRFSCGSYVRPTGGFSMLEMLMEKQPEDVLNLLWQHKLAVIETKKGLKVRYAKKKRT